MATGNNVAPFIRPYLADQESISEVVQLIDNATANALRALDERTVMDATPVEDDG